MSPAVKEVAELPTEATYRRSYRSIPVKMFRYYAQSLAVRPGELPSCDHEEDLSDFHALFDHLRSFGQQGWGYRHPKRTGSLEIDHELDLNRLLDWNPGDLSTTEELDKLAGDYL